MISASTKTKLTLRPAALRVAWTVFCAVFLIMPSLAWGQNKPAKPKQLATNLKGFGIPFRINADDASFIEVQLYISTDQGKNWRFHDRQSTDNAEFPFQALGDGEYWFAIKTLNRNRQLIPEGKPNPELIIIVDTVLPELTFDVKADAAGRIECSWKAFDKNLKADSVQIAYQPIGASPDDWKTVPVNLTGSVRNGSYVDQLSWWPDTVERSLNVRITIADQAGNSVYQERRINVAQSPWRHRNQSTARTGDAVSSGQVLSEPVQPGSTEQPMPVFPFPDNSDAFTQQKSTQQFDSSSPKSSSEFSDYVCENGVCALRPQSEAVSNPAQPSRFAGGTQNGHEPPLIGSKPTIGEPPNPDLYASVPSHPIGHSYAKPSEQDRQNRGSVNWESESERWTQQNRSTSSTVRSPPINNEIAPQRYPENPRDNPALPNPNPNLLTKVGQQVIGESSTNSPNQYRGLPEQQSPIAPPEFLTGDEASNWADLNNPLNNQLTDQLAMPAQRQQTPSQLHTTLQHPTTGSPIQEANNWNRPNRNSGNPNGTSTLPTTYGSGQDNAASVIESPTSFDASLQMIPSKRFRLNYAIDAIDPSGVARVDLWMTRDDGANWKSWGTDPDNNSPFPVEVEEEGRYGFRIVIHSKDGLTGRAPSRGEKPDIFVHVDTQAPLAQIVSVPYGRAEEAGRLVINYRVTDPHLTLRPIHLYYANNPSGPWTPIEEGLRNEGRYIWKPTSNVPDRVFLRLDAVDRAGNKGSHTLSQAIDVSGLVPRGTIHGVVPVGDR